MTRVFWNFFRCISARPLNRERRHCATRLSFFISRLGRRKRINGLIAWHHSEIRSRASFNRRAAERRRSYRRHPNRIVYLPKQHVRWAFIDSWLCTDEFLRLLRLEKTLYCILRSLLWVCSFYARFGIYDNLWIKNIIRNCMKDILHKIK